MSSPHALNGLIPLLLRRQLSDATVPAHEARRFPAAMLIADVSGFTSLAERLTARGPDGVEELSRLVNRWFGAMVDVIAGHGGDVIRFAGDAPIAAFPAPEGDLRDAVARARACGGALLEVMRSLATAEANVSVRVGIGAGEIAAVVAGGTEGRWEFVVGGGPVDQMSEAQRSAAPGSIGFSPEAAAVLGDWPPAPTPAPLDVPSLDAPRLRPFVPPVALRFIDAGQSAWTAELRHVTVLFLGIAGVDLGAADGPQRLQEVLSGLQAGIFSQDGSLVQFLVDDKGLTLLAAWGVPGHRHEDDAARAIRAAWACRAAVHGAGASVRGGLATGRVFCGWRGNDRRREYALIGAVVNRAARLMTASWDHVLCDDATAGAGAAAGRFEDGGLLTLKGSATPARAWRPVEGGLIDRSAPAGGSAAMSAATDIVGREAERAVLADALAALGHGSSSTVVIRGDAGMGKSTLVASFLQLAGTEAVTLAAGSVDAASSARAYLPWQAVLRGILGVDGSIEAQMAALNAVLATHPADLDYVPLLAEIVGVPVPESEATSRLVGPTRVEKTHDLVVDLLQRAAASRPLVIVLDNLHWMDSLSISLAHAVRRRVTPLLLVVVTRPLGPDAPGEARELADMPSARLIDLSRLAAGDVRLLMCRRLGVTHVPDELAAIVEERSAGYPLFVGELVSALLDAGVIQTSGSAAVLVDNGARLRSHRFPDSVQGAIADRLDRLGVAEQLTMKVAAAIGTPFDADTVAAVHPLTPAPAALDGYLETLLERGFLVRTDATYRVGHAVMQDVAYGMMLSDQRRALHAAIAGWFERAHQDVVAPAMMAHHWTEAGEPAKSLHWLERAGEDASRLGAMREVLRHFGRAFDIAGQPSAPPLELLRRVRWLRRIGHAHSELGASDESTRQLLAALNLLGKRVPASGAAMGARLGREAIQQAGLLAGVLRAPARMSASAHDRALEEAEVLRLIGKLAFFAQDHLRYITVSLQSINLAERAGARETAASAYAALGYVVAMLGLERLARRWWRLADESGEVDARLSMLSGRMLFLNSQARWEESAGAAADQAQLIARAGTSASLPSHLMIVSYIHLHHGRYEEAAALVARWLDWCLSVNHLQQAFSAHLQMTTVLLEQGRLDDAARHLAEADAFSGQVTDPLFLSIYHGVAVEARLASGDLEAARVPAEALRQVMTATSPYFGDMVGYVALTKYYLAVHRAAGAGATGGLRDARWAHRVLARHARFNPYARPRTWLLDGRIAEASGQGARAHRSWHRALALAERYDMPREIARAHADLGRDQRLSAEARLAHAREARDWFERMGSLHLLSGSG